MYEMELRNWRRLGFGFGVYALAEIFEAVDAAWSIPGGLVIAVGVSVAAGSALWWRHWERQIRGVHEEKAALRVAARERRSAASADPGVRGVHGGGDSPDPGGTAEPPTRGGPDR